MDFLQATPASSPIHRGNIDALFPYGAALRNGEPPAFLPNAVAIKVPEPPDFIGTGDFDADGHWDIVTAHLGSNAMYFLRGDGHGNFAAAQRIALSGSVTAFTTGEINRADGLTDIVVGVTNGNGSQAVVFESPTGAIRATPETFSLPAPATSMVLGMIAGGPMRDLAIGAGNQLIVIHGRDRKLSFGSAAQNTVATANVTHQVLPFAVKALALGHFSDTAESRRAWRRWRNPSNAKLQRSGAIDKPFKRAINGAADYGTASRRRVEFQAVARAE